jgi:acetyl/propionyl-CoA carboxylase alpha subunit
VHADDRPAAVARLRRALDETVIGGVETDLGFLRWLVEEPGFASGQYDTGLIERAWGDGPPLSADERSLAALIALEARAREATGVRPAGESPGSNPGGAWGALARREAVGRRRTR